MISPNIDFILTDIEGTTSSISFVHEILFPYFLRNIEDLKKFEDTETFREIAREVNDEKGEKLSTEDLILQLKKWAEEDRKIKPLKTAQGLIWQNAYENGEVKGHVYADVAPNFKRWQEKGLKTGIFSSGSVAAQKLLFKHSDDGDLTVYLSAYFDTATGGKKEMETYRKIAGELKVRPEKILFLSDIPEELKAADEAGFSTVQLLREGTQNAWSDTVKDFNEITQILEN